MTAPDTADHRPRVVVITGGGTGIGAATAARYGADGDAVVILGRRLAPLQEVAEATGAHPIVADSSDRLSSEAAIAEVVQRFGHLDVLVANAGGHGFAAAAETDDEAWVQSFDGNVTTAFTIARAALPHLEASGGQIVIVSSLAGLFSGPSVVGYTVGKHALIGLTKSLARDYSPRGVRVNAVCPGWVRTPMADGEMDEFASHAAHIDDREAAYAEITKDVPLQRAAEPTEIASVIRFLGSQESSYITGATIVADGGAHIVDLPTLGFEHAGM
ncbi:SDR family NAD(P)-dependent oxidoreductase [Brevibacterium aurantiacum]|uniref:SDR family NAD(P)-dependent oxidoreductase n=1 Tax=Brevibacterium aurantiacum TaxID=273384 RepID=UPI001866849D|nr:SDR family oxidoreductase [Brevibacterium aurantiacum]